MKRRDFLKILSAAPAIAAVPVLATPNEAVKDEFWPYGNKYFYVTKSMSRMCYTELRPQAANVWLVERLIPLRILLWQP